MKEDSEMRLPIPDNEQQLWRIKKEPEKELLLRIVFPECDFDWYILAIRKQPTQDDQKDTATTMP